MHYKNGREAKVGDVVLTRDYKGQPYTGIITSIQPGSSTCNATVVPLPVMNSYSITLSETLHADDAIKRPVASWTGWR